LTITTTHGVANGEREADRVELTVAFTDLADFTTYTETEGDAAARRLLIGHHRESASIVRSRGGRVVKWLGDGLMLTFASPESAVLACLELGEAALLPLRAGIHGGNVLVTGDDIVGRVVNLAARVSESAKGGDLVVTDYVRSAMGCDRGVAFDGPRWRRFKGIRETVQVYLASRGD
jgi:adenylate cyclase